ncbi:disks large-associated protein 2 [Pteropus vampyrus]|uniref:Disks large-associated protein 2 n=1 Tax=Pteropus vampyrus TaxID=132908 RepID=A0A6P3RN25_PTEVA|nr:disks large-associated protein 2 [Pteropus vampyrus]
MKGLTGSRNQPQLCPGHTCGFTALDGCSHAHELALHGPEARRPYLLSPTDSCPGDRHRCSPRSSVHSDCMMVPVVLGDHVSSSTFPRTHCSSHYDTRDDCAVSHASAKTHRIPANLLDQFEKQLPLHRDGFHTLQYQRASAPEPRGESPGRIRHLVHSVQKLFTKSHSLEGASKSNVNGTKGDGRVDDHHGRHAKHGRRSKSKERVPEAKQRSGLGSWWSSDDNLDSDSTYRAASVAARHFADHGPHCYPEPFLGPFAGLSLKPSKSNSDVKCSACEGLGMAPEATYMKRSSWSTLTVSQAKEACRKSSLNLDRPLAHQDIKPPLRPCHYLQHLSDCGRGASSARWRLDARPRPGQTRDLQLQRERLEQLAKQLSLCQSYLQAASDGPAGHSLDPSAHYNSPKFRSRNQSYMRAVSTLSQASCVSQMSEAELNGQLESVCESVFSEMEVQAMDALGLPGCFRTRSHSYLRAIQAGYSQDDECCGPLRTLCQRWGKEPLRGRREERAPQPSRLDKHTLLEVPLPVHRFRRVSRAQVTSKHSSPETLRNDGRLVGNEFCFRAVVVQTVKQDTFTELTQEPFGFCNVQTLIWTFSACGAATERCGGFGHVQGGMALAAGSAPSSSRACAFCDKEKQSTPVGDPSIQNGDWGQSIVCEDGSHLGRPGSVCLSVAEPLCSLHADLCQAGGGDRRLGTGQQIVGSLSMVTVFGSLSSASAAWTVPGTAPNAELCKKERQPYPRSDVETGTDSDTESRGLREYHSVGVQVEDEKRQIQIDVYLPDASDFNLREAREPGPRAENRWRNLPLPEARLPVLPLVEQAQCPEHRGVAHRQSRSGEAAGSERTLATGPRSPIRNKPLPRTTEPTAPANGQARSGANAGRHGRALGEPRTATANTPALAVTVTASTGHIGVTLGEHDPSAMPRPTSQDLAGYWDMLQLSVEDVSMKFSELHQLKQNGWKALESPERERKLSSWPPPLPQKVAPTVLVASQARCTGSRRD